MLEASALEKLVPLLSDHNSEVRLNSIKALTLLAETPKAKQELETILPKVQSVNLDNHAEKATDAFLLSNTLLYYHSS